MYMSEGKVSWGNNLKILSREVHRCPGGKAPRNVLLALPYRMLENVGNTSTYWICHIYLAQVFGEGTLVIIGFLTFLALYWFTSGWTTCLEKLIYQTKMLFLYSGEGRQILIQRCSTPLLCQWCANEFKNSVIQGILLWPIRRDSVGGSLFTLRYLS